MRTSPLCRFASDCIDYNTLQKTFSSIHKYMHECPLAYSSGYRAHQHHRPPKQNLASTKVPKPTVTCGRTRHPLNHGEGERHTDFPRLASHPVRQKSPSRIPVREWRPPASKLHKKTRRVDALSLSLPRQPIAGRQPWVEPWRHGSECSLPGFTGHRANLYTLPKLETPSRQPLEVFCTDELTGRSAGVLLVNCVPPGVWHQKERFVVSQRRWWVGNVEWTRWPRGKFWVRWNT
jgi:hypothetical protein